MSNERSNNLTAVGLSMVAVSAAIVVALFWWTSARLAMMTELPFTVTAVLFAAWLGLVAVCVGRSIR